MNILFLGHLWHGFKIPGAVYIQQALEEMGHEVVAFDFSYWRQQPAKILEPGDLATWKPLFLAERERMLALDFDFVLACKGITSRNIERLGETFKCPVVYWCWDRMMITGWPPSRKHLDSCAAADLYLSPTPSFAPEYREAGAAFRYLPLDVAQREFGKPGRQKPKITPGGDTIPVLFTGTCYGRWGRRIDTFLEIERLLGSVEFHAFGNGHWEREGFTRHHPHIWGHAFQAVVEKSKVCLAAGGFVPHLEGCWSNRNARYMGCGGFTLSQYVPGMERTFGPDGENLVYWQTAEDCVEKIKYYLVHEDERVEIAARGQQFAKKYLTIDYRVQQMMTIVCMELGL